MKVLLTSFRLNCHTEVFHPKTQKVTTVLHDQTLDSGGKKVNKTKKEPTVLNTQMSIITNKKFTKFNSLLDLFTDRCFMTLKIKLLDYV